MSPTSSHPSPAQRLAALLGTLGVTHVATVPDNSSAPLLRALEDSRTRSESTPRVLYVTREGEGMGLAAGLWLGGASPLVLIQNTGLLEAGDALRGTLARMGAPVLLFVTCRGFQKSRAAGLDPADGVASRETLVRNDLDSVAAMTEGTLRAWGIPHVFLRDTSNLEPVQEAAGMAAREERPVAVLIDATLE